MSKTIRFKISKGKVEIEGEGFQGQSCDVAIGRFLKALGGPVEEVQRKPAYYEAETEQQAELEQNA